MNREVFCLFIFVFIITLQQVMSLCPNVCRCRGEPSSCPAGVSLVTDGCSCCKVCAKQLGQQCNDDDSVCDVHRHLFCDFSASRSGDWGMCKARSGRSCWHGDTSVPSGTKFAPSCKKRCWCIDGVVACIPTCPHETQIPRHNRCVNPRLRSVHGQCCDEWVCDSPTGGVFSLSLDEFWDDFVQDSGDDINVPSDPINYIGNGVREGPVYEDDIGDNIDELRDFQVSPNIDVEEQRPDLYNMEENWGETNNIPGDIHAHLQAEKASRERLKQCRPQVSGWSPCSKTCGLGVSTRITNDNAQCQLEREQRLCEMRPCNDQRYNPKKGRPCLKHKRARKRTTIRYAGCVSLKKIRRRFCGSCHDNEKCCTPKQTKTARLLFRCEDGQTIAKKIQVIVSCHCHKKCESLAPAQGSMKFMLFGDMHRLQHG